MKSSTMIGLGAACLGVLAVTAGPLYWAFHARISSSEAAAPLATPPGISTQLSSAQQVVFADARGMTLYIYARYGRERGGSGGLGLCRRLRA